jgi:hypothetical protein
LTGSVFPCICRLRNPLISTEECSMLWLLCLRKKVHVLYTRAGFPQ